EGALRLAVGHPRDAGHLRRAVEIFEIMGFVDEKHLNPQFLPADRRFGIASLLARRVEQLRLQPPDRALDLLHAPARYVILISVFEFLEVGAELRQLAFDEAGGGRLAHWKQGETGMGYEDQVPIPGRDS